MTNRLNNVDEEYTIEDFLNDAINRSFDIFKEEDSTTKGDIEYKPQRITVGVEETTSSNINKVNKDDEERIDGKKFSPADFVDIVQDKLDIKDKKINKLDV